MTLDGSCGSGLAGSTSWLGISSSGSVIHDNRTVGRAWGPTQPLSWGVTGHPIRRVAQGSSTSASENRAEGTSPVLSEPQKSRGTNFAAFLVTKEVRNTPRFEGSGHTLHLFIRGPSGPVVSSMWDGNYCAAMVTQTGNSDTHSPPWLEDHVPSVIFKTLYFSRWTFPQPLPGGIF